MGEFIYQICSEVEIIGKKVVNYFKMNEVHDVFFLS